jgi:hypothetical protein
MTDTPDLTPEAVERLKSHADWLRGDHEHCNPWLADTLGALTAENARLRAGQEYRYVGRNGKTVLARDLEDRADAAEAELARLRATRADELERAYRLGVKAAVGPVMAARMGDADSDLRCIISNIRALTPPADLADRVKGGEG